MNEEEKQAIEYWKTHMEILHCNTQIASEHYIKVLLDLVEKQQKQNEELKKEKRILIEKYTDVVYECGKRSEEIKKLKLRKYIFNAETNEIKEIPISEDYISKDKIKELREIDNIDLIQFKLKELLGE